jgi:hypothetical protein
MIKHESQAIREWEDCADLEVLKGGVPCGLTSAGARRHTTSVPLRVVSL